MSILSVLTLLVVPAHALVVGIGASTHAAHRAVRAPSMLFGGGGKDEGAGGGLNMMETIKKAQQVGVKVKELQEELANTEIEATAAEGGVSVSVSGANVPISVSVSDELLAKGADAVSEAVTLAAKEAHKNSMSYAKDRMTELYTEIGLPMPPAQ